MGSGEESFLRVFCRPRVVPLRTRLLDFIRSGGHGIGLAVILWTLLAAGQGPAVASQKLPPHRIFPDVELLNHEGKRLRFYEDLIRDKVVAINFMFTSCRDSCPAETARLREVHDLLGDRVGQDIFMISISVDPEHDTPEVLAQYVKKFKIGKGWQFLMGSIDDIEMIQKRLAMTVTAIDSEPDDHDISLLMGNERTGQWVKRSPFDNPNHLARLVAYRLFDGQMKMENARSYAEVPEVTNLTSASYLFDNRCSSCHSIGGGESLGPDLLGVTIRRDRDWLARWIREPDQMLLEGDPQALAVFREYRELPMPNLRLRESEVELLIQYMEERDEEIGRSGTKALARE